MKEKGKFLVKKIDPIHKSSDESKNSSISKESSQFRGDKKVIILVGLNIGLNSLNSRDI
jgi:hypothetical protein